MARRGQQLNTGPIGFFGTGNAISTAVTYSLAGGATQLVITSTLGNTLNVGQNRIWNGQIIVSNTATVTVGNGTALQINSAGFQHAMFPDSGTHLWATVATATFAMASNGGSSISNFFPNPFGNSAFFHYVAPVGMTLSNTAGAATDSVVGTVSITYLAYARAD